MAPPHVWTSIGISGGGAMYTPVVSPHDPNLMMLNCDMSCAFRSTDGGGSWEMIHYEQLLASTRCRPVFHPTDPNVIFAANGWEGDLKISRDRGVTWSRIGRGLPSRVAEIAIAPGNPSLMLVAAEEGIYRSTDGGETWSRCADVRGEGVGFHIARTSPVGSRTCFAGTSAGIFRSRDGGATWEEADRGLPWKELRAFAGGSDAADRLSILYCVIEMRDVDGEPQGGVYRSDDGGEKWVRAMGAGINVAPRRRRLPQYRFLLTTDARPRTVYVTGERGGAVYRSDDAGRSWREVLFTRSDSPQFNVEPDYIISETGGWRQPISGAGINPADPENVVVTDWMCCWITRDGGATWKAGHTRPAPGQASDGKGLRWVNNGLTVTTVWHYYVDPFQHNRHYIAYTDIGYARSEDAGKTWYWQHGQPLRNTTYELAFDPETPGRIWAAFADLHDIPNMNVISGRHYSPEAGGGVGVSDDFGVTWRDTSTGLPDKPVISIVLDPRSPKTNRVLYASLFEAGVFKSTDGGQTWVGKSNGLGREGDNLRACRLILHPDGALFVLVTALTQGSVSGPAGAGLYRSRDGGDTWEWINRSQPLDWPKDFDVDPRDSDTIYLGAADLYQDDGGLYKTTDGGQTWRRIARKGTGTFGATVHPRRPGRVYMTLCEGSAGPALWLSDDAGQTWKPFRGLPFQNVQRVGFDPDDDSLIYVSTFGGSLWKGPAEE